jgi:hypothetical protein
MQLVPLQYYRQSHHDDHDLNDSSRHIVSAPPRNVSALDIFWDLILVVAMSEMASIVGTNHGVTLYQFYQVLLFLFPIYHTWLLVALWMTRFGREERVGTMVLQLLSFLLMAGTVANINRCAIDVTSVDWSACRDLAVFITTGRVLVLLAWMWGLVFGVKYVQFDVAHSLCFTFSKICS